MICPDCGARAKVVDSRPTTTTRWRKYRCPEGHEFTTEETYKEAGSPQYQAHSVPACCPDCGCRSYSIAHQAGRTFWRCTACAHKQEV